VLDRETICPYSLTCDLSLDVKVKIVQFLQMFKVIVHLVDVNDNSPVFPQARMTISIVETTAPGALFLVQAAEDFDSGVLGVQEYQLLSDHDQFELKVTDHIDGSKDVRLKLMSRLDREVEDTYVMRVVAMDGGRPQRSGSVDVHIVVLDSNDNNPTFDEAAYEATIYENLPIGTSVISVHATDPDHGPSGVIVYSFADYTLNEYGAIFRIDDKTGEIYLKGEVDYENVKSFPLSVIASDMGSGSLPVYAKVTVNVLDVNDNEPRIVVNVLTGLDVAQVKENSAVGTFVAHAAVTDKDSGVNGQVECFIDGRGLFKLEALYDSEYKIVTAVVFDREEESDYTVMMTCHDKAVPALTSSARIDISILDDNDNSPQLFSSIFSASINENNVVNSVVMKINATDADSGRNCALLYRIRPLSGTPENVLSIDPITGRITAMVAFDFEKRREYRFQLTVSDHGDVPQSTTVTFLLNVTDTNDERPRFDKSIYYFTTQENQPLGTVIGTVTANDSDRTAEFRQMTYRLLASGHVAFEINEETGDIFTVRRLDREEHATHSFLVIVSNEGFPSMETRANVTVYIDDLNDNNPFFIFPNKEVNTVEISSSSGIGALVTRLIASDVDIGANAEVQYSILNGNLDNIFDIDPSTGVIILAKEFEHTRSSNKLYKLVVVARDNGAQPLQTVADLRVIANSSFAPSAAAFSAASIFEGTNLVIFIGAGFGFILVMTSIIMVLICVVRRSNRRSRQKYITEMVTAASSGSPCNHHCQSPVCSSRITGSRGHPEGSITTSIDTNSIMSGGNQGPGHHSCEYRESVDGLEETYSIINNPWHQQVVRVIAVSAT